MKGGVKLTDGKSKRTKEVKKEGGALPSGNVPLKQFKNASEIASS